MVLKHTSLSAEFHIHKPLHVRIILVDLCAVLVVVLGELVRVLTAACRRS